MKIGELVKSFIPVILDEICAENKTELKNLMSKEYSKQIFGINYQFLVDEDSKIIETDSRRFWKRVYQLDGKNYRVCSQWIIDYKYKFLDYLWSFGLIDDLKYQELDNLVIGLKKERFQQITKIYRKKNVTELEAETMSIQYKRFYMIERSIRILIEEVMSSSYGNDWWRYIDDRVKKNVESHLNYELDTSHTKRSNRKIDYTTFGDLRKIINNHWEIFEKRFKRNLNSVNDVLVDLNRLRVSIAHCTPLAKKEIKRLDIRIDDWKQLLN